MALWVPGRGGWCSYGYVYNRLLNRVADRRLIEWYLCRYIFKGCQWMPSGWLDPAPPPDRRLSATSRKDRCKAPTSQTCGA